MDHSILTWLLEEENPEVRLRKKTRKCGSEL